MRCPLLRYRTPNTELCTAKHSTQISIISAANLLPVENAGISRLFKNRTSVLLTTVSLYYEYLHATPSSVHPSVGIKQLTTDERNFMKTQTLNFTKNYRYILF